MLATCNPILAEYARPGCFMQAKYPCILLLHYAVKYQYMKLFIVKYQLMKFRVSLKTLEKKRTPKLGGCYES